jgi:glutamate-1-semialdehyde 2,1-aminomutase
MIDRSASNNLYEEAKKILPGGVNSPVRAFRSVNGSPIMSAIRLARGYTGKNKVVKFEGCYHGHVDSLMVKAGSGLATLGTSTSAGIPEGFVKETIVLPLNDKGAVRAALKEFGHDIACIAIEPIPANNGLLLQDKEFLLFLREICDETGILLFFDEVISGFRVSFEGASGYYGIKPDMVAFGKIIGGGFPVGAYASSAKVMDCVSPDGPVYQAGTLSGNPVAMSAGIAQLEECLKPGFYENLASKADSFVNRIQSHADSKGYPFHMFNVGSIFWLSFSNKNRIRSADEIAPNGPELFRVFFDALIEKGVYIGPSSFEVGFISEAHTDEDLSKAAKAIIEALDTAYAK